MRGALLAAALALAAADLPVHCVHRDILGKWEFRLGSADGDNSATCGHGVPDRVMTMVHSSVTPMNPRFAVKRTLDVELLNPNVAIGPDGRRGTWTAIYDEGIEVNMDGWNYMTFFRYLPRFAGADPNKVEQFHSICNETVSGWYHPHSEHGVQKRNWGCFVARQTERAIPLNSPEYSQEQVSKRNKLESGELILSATLKSRFAQADMAARDDAAGEASSVSNALATGMDSGDSLLNDNRAASSRLRRASTATGAHGKHSAVAAAALRVAEESASVEEEGDESSEEQGDQEASPLSLMELSAVATVSSHEAILGLQTAESAAEVVRKLNSVSGKLWTAGMPPEHFIGMSHNEARARLGHSTSGKSRVPATTMKRIARAHGHHAAAAVAAASGSSESFHASSSAHESAVYETAQYAEVIKKAGGKHTALPNGDLSKYPESLDWSTIEHGAYLPPVLDQGQCGSCYAAASADAITARARIRAKGALNHLVISPQSVVQCSSYNQGCDGGYPFLVGKFGADIGFVPVECMKYTASNGKCPGNVQCPQLAQLMPTWKSIMRNGGGSAPAAAAPASGAPTHAFRQVHTSTASSSKSSSASSRSSSSFVEVATATENKAAQAADAALVAALRASEGTTQEQAQAADLLPVAPSVLLDMDEAASDSVGPLGFDFSFGDHVATNEGVSSAAADATATTKQADAAVAAAASIAKAAARAAGAAAAAAEVHSARARRNGGLLSEHHHASGTEDGMPQFRQSTGADSTGSLSSTLQEIVAASHADAVQSTHHSRFSTSDASRLQGAGAAELFSEASAESESFAIDSEAATANTYAMADRLPVSRYEYVGGYYGACNEEAMVRELQDGPIIIAFNSPGDLFYYTGGIYHHSMKPEAEYDVTPISRWEKTNHAVLLVGYGVDVVDGRKVKYWKIKNSWSARWGEHQNPSDPSTPKGYFRMLRGDDCTAVESMAVVIDP